MHESKLHDVACMLYLGFTLFISVGEKKKSIYTGKINTKMFKKEIECAVFRL